MMPLRAPGDNVAYTWDFDPVHQILRSTFTGKVTDGDLLNYQRMTALLVSALDPLAAIADFTDADPFEATPDGVRRLAKLPPAMPKTDRPRVIVAPVDHVFGMARIFEIEGEATRPSLHIVRSVAEAWVIIGVVEPHFEPIPSHILAAIPRDISKP